jgi:hypothetical protein
MTNSEAEEILKRIEALKASPDRMPGELLEAGIKAWKALIAGCQSAGRKTAALQQKLGQHGLLARLDALKMNRSHALRWMALAKMTIDWNSAVSVSKAIIASGVPNAPAGAILATFYLKLRAKNHQ